MSKYMYYIYKYINNMKIFHRTKLLRLQCNSFTELFPLNKVMAHYSSVNQLASPYWKLSVMKFLNASESVHQKFASPSFPLSSYSGPQT